VYEARVNMFRVLLTGPPGIGKTFLAESFLRKHQLRHIIVRGPELLDKYVGESEKAVRDLFLKLRAQRPMVILQCAEAARQE
jgi:SpoVK/Ycf46/Vps4 family AAA+-type ATPase